VCLLIAACGGPRPGSATAPGGARAAETPAVPEQWDGLVQEFVETYFAANPTFAADQGRHEFDGQLPDLSPEGIESSIRTLQAFQQRVARFDSRALDEGRQFERAYLQAKLDSTLFWLTKAPRQDVSPMFFVQVIDPSLYLTRDYAPLAQRLAAYTKLASAVPRLLTQMKANLRPPLPRTQLELGLRYLRGMASYLNDDVPRAFATVEDDTLQEALTENTRQAVAAVNEATAWLAALLPQATEEFALGEHLFAEMLWDTERVRLPLAQLKVVGQRDLQRNLGRLAEVCARLAPGASRAECVAQVQAGKPAEGPVVAARSQLAALRQFVVDEGLVTIPGRAQARVEEAPPYQRWNSAYIEMPGPYDRELPSIYYIAPPDPAWSAADRLAYVPGEADLLYVTVHEVWPGHFLQNLHASQVESLLGPLFASYAFSEGWAHYAEEMMWEAGLASGEPASEVGQLLNALLRNVRFLCAIGLHTEGMTVAEAEVMFREQAFQDPGNARQQAARGTFDPGYLAYTLGKLIVRKLRQDWTAARGGRAAWRAFHDQLLSYGGPPLPLARQAMLGDGELL
jgi:uncharacterized protein (DUF885 family)